ncbi:MAG: hypothetical protein ACFCVH_03835 [Alphaproteobacteria bacterium]
MFKSIQATALAAALLAAPVALAQGPGNDRDADAPMDSEMMPGMTDQEGMAGMMDQEGMTGMMPMMQQMGEMMQTCNTMMQAMIDRPETPGTEPGTPDVNGEDG